MAKVLETIYRITGEVSGSLLGAIATANNAMRGLNVAAKATTPKLADTGALSKQLKALRQLQTELEKYKALQGALGQQQIKYYNAQKQLSERSRQWRETSAQNAKLYEQIRLQERVRDRASTTSERQNATRELKALREQYRAGTEKSRQEFESKEQAERELARVNAVFRSQKSELSALVGQLNAAGYATSNLSSAQAQLSNDLSRATKALQQQSLKNVLNANEAVNRHGQNFNTAVDNVSNALDTSRQIIEPLAEATRTAMTFEAAVSKTKALTQMDRLNSGDSAQIALANERVAMLQEKYMEIGRTTKFSATEAANAGNFMAMAGMSDEVILQGLKPIVNLATATGSSFEQAADIITNVMTAFGEDWNDPKIGAKINEYADKMTYGTTHANMTLGMLGETLKYAAPIARGFGSDISESIAMAKFSHDAGVQASMAGTSMRSMFLRLSAPPKQAFEAMQQNGIVLSDAMKEWMGAQEILSSEGFNLEQMNPEMEAKLKRGFFDFAQQWDEKMSGKSDREQLAIASALFGKNAASGAVNILNATSKGLAKFTEDLDKSAGSAEQTSAVMMENAEGAWISLKSALEAVQIGVGNAFLPTVKSMLDGLTSLARSTATFANEHPELIKAFGGLTAAIAATISGLAIFRAALAGLQFAKSTLELLKATAGLRTATQMASLLGVNVAGSAAANAAASAGASALTNAAANAGAAGAASRAGMPPIAPTTVSAERQAKRGRPPKSATLPSAITNALGNASANAGAIGNAAANAGAIGNAAAGSAALANAGALGNASANAGALGNAAANAGALGNASANAGAIGNAAANAGAIGNAAANAGAIGNAAANAGALGNAAAGSAVAANAAANAAGSASAASRAATSAGSAASAAAANTGGIAAKLAPFMQVGGWANIGNAVKTTFVGAFDSVVTKIGAIKNAFTGFNPLSALGSGINMVIGAVTSLGGFFRTVLSFSFSPLTAGLLAIGTVAYSVFSVIQSNGEQISSFFNSIGERLSNAFSNAFTTLEPSIERVQQAWSRLQSAFDENTALWQAVQSITDAIGSGLVTAIEAAVSIFVGFAEATIPVFTAIVEAVLNVATQILDVFTAVFQGDIPAVLSTIPGVFSAVFEGARAVAEAALNGILSLVQSIAAAISSISFGALTSAAGSASTGAISGIDKHAEGGIFARGAHLTWFAEDSAEAAIPIDGSRNAIGLWQKTGEMLGILPKKQPSKMPNSEPQSIFAKQNPIIEIFNRLRGADFTTSLQLPYNFKATSMKQSGGAVSNALNEYERSETAYRDAAEQNTWQNSEPHIELHFHFAGNVDREEVKQAIAETNIEEQLRRYWHEVSRRSFA